MARYRFKIVPDETPNAEGEWREADIGIADDSTWLDALLALADHVPETHYLVSAELVKSSVPTWPINTTWLSLLSPFVDRKQPTTTENIEEIRSTKATKYYCAP